jgi:hypothetical protein
MSFEQTLGFFIVGAILTPSAFLAWHRPAAFRSVAILVVIVVVGLGAMGSLVIFGYIIGADDQWRAAVQAASPANVLAHSVNIPSVHNYPVPLWMWECGLLVLFAEFVLIVVQPFLHPDRKTQDDQSP